MSTTNISILEVEEHHNRNKRTPLKLVFFCIRICICICILSLIVFTLDSVHFMQTTLNKAIITGNLHELFKYEKPISYGFKFTLEQLQRRKRNAFSNNLDLSDEERKERQELYLKCSSERAKLKIRRLVQGNMYRFKVSAKFLTLTFNTQIEDLSIANKIFTNFIKRFDRKAGYKIRYVAVPEFQKNGRVHYHMILFNAPFISEKSIALDIWKNGSVDIQTVYKTKGLCTYMSKYISKSF